MVNIEEFSKRLKIIIDYYKISAAILAERMNVQPSSISHILSGRNKPSLDFVLKILKSFPEVELYWLLNGVGDFPKNVEIVPPAPTLEMTSTETEIKNVIGEDLNKKESAIERIVIFYKDGSFKNYNP